MTEKTAARLESLRKRKAQLERRIADAESEAKVAARKLDARRKIVVGGAVLAAIADSPGLAAMVNPARVSRHDRGPGSNGTANRYKETLPTRSNCYSHQAMEVQ